MQMYPNQKNKNANELQIFTIEHQWFIKLIDLQSDYCLYLYVW